MQFWKLWPIIFFFQVYLFFLSICINCRNVNIFLQKLSLLCHHSTPKPNSNSPEPELFHRLRLQLKSPAPSPQYCLEQKKLRKRHIKTSVAEPTFLWLEPVPTASDTSFICVPALESALLSVRGLLEKDWFFMSCCDYRPIRLAGCTHFDLSLIYFSWFFPQCS